MRRSPRRLAAMNGMLAGNTEPLGYFYTRLRVGTPGQDFTVIVDTGSALLAVPCEGCKTCGRHTSRPFVAADSSSFRTADCNAHRCSACDHGECTYHERFVEGSSISGKLSLERLGLVPASPSGKASSDTEPSVVVDALFGCQTSESGYFKSQEADGILGLGRGSVPTLLDVLTTQGPSAPTPPTGGQAAAAQHGAPLPDTMSFCIGRTGGHVALGVQPPQLEMPAYVPPDEPGGDGGEGNLQGLASPYAAMTALRPHKKHYIISIRSLTVRACPRLRNLGFCASRAATAQPQTVFPLCRLTLCCCGLAGRRYRPRHRPRHFQFGAGRAPGQRDVADLLSARCTSPRSSAGV